MKADEFGPSYTEGTWVQVRDKGWGTVLSVYWTDEHWKYNIYLDETLEIVEFSEEDIVF